MRRVSSVVFVPVDDYVGVFADAPDGVGHTHRCADAVQIPELVSHDQHPVGILDQLRQGVCHDPGLHLGTLVHALGNAAVELIDRLVFDGRLIAAPAQRHIQRLPCGGFALSQGLFSPAHADGKSDRQVPVGLDRADVI